MTAPEPEWIPVTLDEMLCGGVYRFFSGDRCLYVGQSRSHPLFRMFNHRSASWWPEVTHADYMLIPDGLEHVTVQDTRLDTAEDAEIRTRQPEFNIRMGKRGWKHSEKTRQDLRERRARETQCGDCGHLKFSLRPVMRRCHCHCHDDWREAAS